MLEWLITFPKPSTSGQTLPEKLVKALRDLFKDGSERWIGMGTGIVAQKNGIGDALDKLDETIRKHLPGDEPAQSAGAPPVQAAEPEKSDAKGLPQADKKRPQLVKKEPDVIELD